MKRHASIVAVALLAGLSACSAAPRSTPPNAGTTSGAEQENAATPAEVGLLGPSGIAAALRDVMAPDYGAPAAADVERVAVPIDGAPARGAELPAVTIVVFSDFQCPFCARLAPTLARLRAAYPDDLRVVFRHSPLPFHEHAQEAAELTEVAFDLGGNEAFWRVHDLLFQNHRQLERADLLRYAASAGLDPGEVAQRLDSGTVTARVEAAVRMAARLGVRGTPSSFVNGRSLVGSQPYEAFDAVVREELALAAQEARQGLDRRGLYARRIAGAAARIPEQRPAPRPHEPEPDLRFRVPVDGQPSLGPADALVTIVEFSDFQCPFCSRVEPTLEAVRERYGDDVRIVWRNKPLPFHPNARPAAVAAIEAYEQGGDQAFWRFHDALLANQRQLDRASLESLFVQQGLNRNRLRRAVERGTHDARIDADLALAERLDVLGTPAFFINGRNLRGAQPLQTFVAMIDDALREARAAVQQGTPRSAVYEAVTRDGLTESPATHPAAAPR